MSVPSVPTVPPCHRFDSVIIPRCHEIVPTVPSYGSGVVPVRGCACQGLCLSGNMPVRGCACQGLCLSGNMLVRGCACPGTCLSGVVPVREHACPGLCLSGVVPVREHACQGLCLSGNMLVRGCACLELFRERYHSDNDLILTRCGEGMKTGRLNKNHPKI